ncbi:MULTISPECIES: hypothetical protein [Paenarthrobacter]|uniref:hypothetical protein n=1 Tax=Paenarthrobacter TaxID=1742992 RepID=UPI0023669874|nr:MULTISPECIES: hypothetical protein [Paenarthrobacter]MDD7836928.1 hypothetical protein [Paenarthrobacter sp. AB444]MDP9934349.1 hypothetical protein [Paenarthrobacter nicotinovorans]
MSSQEQRPIRSRRELRRAREENPEVQSEAAAPQQADTAVGAERLHARNRRAADAPVDAVGAAAQERSSQIRARDRAALRTIKELADKEEQLSGGGPPTRRQLRLQQLQAEVATSMNPVVPLPGAKGEAAVKDGGKQQAPAQQEEVAPLQDSTQKQEPAQPAKAVPSGAPSGPAESGMSVEQALAVRELIAAQVQNQTSKLEHIAEQDPLAVDPDVLAQQIALAERAAVLNKRAAAKQKLAEQNQAGPNQAGQGKAPSASAGPSTANNLAMVTPLEFVKVPGVERPVMKRPSTTFVPVVTSSGPKLDAAQAPAKERAPRGRAGVLARAEAVARSARNKSATRIEPGEEAQRPPVSASTAYGLDPLDANTAGLARAQRNRLLQYGVLALGLVALIVGIIMITSG